MMTYKEVKELIELAIKNPEATKEAIEHVNGFIEEVEEIYEEHLPNGFAHEVVCRLYKKLVKEYLTERAYDTN